MGNLWSITLTIIAALVITIIAVSIYKKNNIFDNKRIRWYFWFGGIFIQLIIAYLVLHNIWKGEENVQFTKDEIANIQSIIDAGTQNYDTTLHKELIALDIYTYISSRYNIQNEERFPQNAENLTGSQKFRQFLQQYAKAEFPPAFLTDYRLNISAYFWLTEDLIFLEIIFWSLFGVLCSLFYYTSEAFARDEYDPKHEYIHASKLLYAPLTTLVVYFSLNILISNGEVNLNNLRHGLIILSFLLGFFSGRTIELLSRIKEFLLPYNRGESPNLPNVAATNRFDSLSIDEKQDVLNKVINEYKPKWKAMYKNLVYTAPGNKYLEREGKKSHLRSLVFYVSNKGSDLNEKDVIPDYIDYNGFRIPTDVKEISEPPRGQGVPSLDKKDLYIRAFGCGVSRANKEEFGSMGIIVKKVDNDKKPIHFLISCFHALCPLELQNNWKGVSANKYLGDREVVCPSYYDDANFINNVIGTIDQGIFSSMVDVVLIRLNDFNLISQINEISYPPEIYDVIPQDEDNLMLYMRGRVSTPGSKVSKSALVVHKTCDPPILHEFKNKIIQNNMEWLIQTEKMSERGDSGGPVFTKDKKLVGLIVGGSYQYSYVMPIRHILNSLDVSL